MKSLSIIIPVYNAEKYIKKCMDSILCQSFKNFEILLIDDGSKDSSGKICDEYAKTDERVKVYHIENGGPSRARNFGIKKAKGTYIEFVDADDQLISGALEKLYVFAKENNPEIIIANTQVVTANEGIKDILSIEEQDEMEIKTYLKTLNTTRKAILLHYIWNKWYKRELIVNNEIFFDENERLGEDFLFNCELVNKSTQIFGADIMLYKYYKRDNGSLSGKYIENELSRRRKMDSAFLNLYENKNLKEECYDLIVSMIGSITLASIQGVFMLGSPTKLKEKRVYVKSFLDSEYFNYINIYAQKKKLTKSERLAIILLKRKWIYLYLILFKILKGDRSGKKSN
ncbi:glycosyltransferase family 2 protein [Dorea amylophila]|uniref:Glycosyltransferase family 2 protein n=1 Tax=Dorea amylophila TaxID=2981789 RepID=A0ABW8B1U7_9FIRM